jgi:hypothetical protein
VEYNKIYTLDFTGTVSFGRIPEEVVYEMNRDGRRVSHPLEYELPYHFPNLERIDAKGYDLINHDNDKRKIDHKSYTKGGCNFAPSNMVGKGRKLDIVKATKHAKSIDYVITDVTEFPIVRVKFVNGEELVNKYPKLKIPSSKKARKEIFGA